MNQISISRKCLQFNWPTLSFPRPVCVDSIDFRQAHFSDWQLSQFSRFTPARDFAVRNGQRSGTDG
jgi:hypothetical protein